MNTHPDLPIDLDMLVRWDQSRPTQAGFHSGIDIASRTVRVVGSGIWREDDAQRYFDQQRKVIEEARLRFGFIKVFFDVRDWIVESPQSALQFQDMNAELYKEEDRLAAVVRSSLAKQHPRTALGSGSREAFISMRAAETWLQAYSSGGEPRRPFGITGACA